MSNDIHFSTKKGSRLAGFKGALLRGPKKARRRVSLRVPGVVILTIRRLAIEMDMPLTDLCQLLIYFAGIANFLTLQRQEGLDKFLSSVGLSRSLNVLSGFTGDHEPRTFPGDPGQPVSLRFPALFLDTVGQYARLTGRSRSELLLQFLEQGLRIYVLSWVAVTKALKVAAGNGLNTRENTAT